MSGIMLMQLNGMVLLTGMMLLTACSTSDEVRQDTMLTIYVYSPDHPVMTRGDIGGIDASDAENQVTRLQIWIYDTNGNKVGYLGTTETATLNSGEGAVYQIPVSDDFAERKPNVDVYVLANVAPANCGITTTLTELTERPTLLDNAKINSAHFGLAEALTTAIPADGLPMAGSLKSQPVIGDAPVLRIGTTTQIATVPLTRAVSKLRFFFANTEGASNLSITGITLQAGTIPDEEYLFPQAQTLSYNSSTASLLASTIEEVATKAQPSAYVYDGQTAEAYEALMTGAGLSEAGPYYLRESDKRLEGTITYQVEGIQDPMTATFKMKELGDFSRNHSWIVYAYYEGLSGMQIKYVDVTPWDEQDKNHEVYNW